MEIGKLGSSVINKASKDIVFKETNDEDFFETLYFGECGEMMRDDRRAGNREERFGDIQRKRSKTRSSGRAAYENDSFQL